MQGLRSAQSNAAGGVVVFFEDATDDDTVEDVPEVTALESQGTFELFEDKGGEFRWRLLDGDDIVADSGEGYTERNKAVKAVERVSNYAGDADLLAIGSAAFEIYEDNATEWRWRLRHRNGRIIADSVKASASEAVRSPASNVSNDTHLLLDRNEITET